MNKQPEVRAQTKEKLMDAFLALAREKKVGQISVGELSRLAGYNRSTFYEYFTDMPDLISQAEDMLLKQIRDNLKENDPFRRFESLNERLKSFQVVFHSLNEQIYCLLGPNGDPSFFSRVRDLFLAELFESGGMAVNQDYMEYIAAFVYSAAIGYLQYWNDQGRSMPEDEFFNLGYNMIINGVAGALSDAVQSSEDSGQEKKNE